jgi:hypothetical protein
MRKITRDPEVMKDIINASTEQDTIYLSRISRKLAILVVGFTLIDMLRDEIGTVRCFEMK